MLSAPGLRAVVLETFGAGNAPTNEWFIRVLKEAIDRGVIILNITQCGGGKVSMELYETGLRLQKIGVLCGHDMTTEAAVTKLMYVLGLGLSDEQTRALLRRPLRGEFTALRRCTERFFFLYFALLTYLIGSPKRGNTKRNRGVTRWQTNVWVNSE